MQQNKRIKVLSGLALGGALVLTVALIGPKVGTNIINTFSAKGVGNVLTIDKNSVCDTAKSKVTGKTEKGNSVQFSYSRFDTRPEGDPASYNQLVCFAKVADGLGGYIKNDTAFYSVENIKIYSWSTTNPNPSTLSTSKFNLYYGFEPIVVDHSNTARVEITNGQYTFESGSEPSYIALEAVNSDVYDTLVSRIEISYKCEPVSGTIEEKPQPAYKYDYVGKEFTTSSGKKIPYNIVEEAPWVNVLPTSSKEIVYDTTYSNGTFDAETKTATSTGPLYFGTNLNSAVLAGKKYLSVTMSAVRNTGASWGPDIYVWVNRVGQNSDLMTRVYGPNPANNGWEPNEKILPGETITDPKTGALLNGVNLTGGKKFTVTFDVSSVASINNVWIGTSVPAIMAIDDITFKDTLCGHSLSDIVEETHNKPYQYEFEGTLTKCGVCGKIVDNSKIINPSPWAHADIFDDSGTNFTTVNSNSTYNSLTKTWSTTGDDYLVITPLNGSNFAEANGRKLITARINYSIVSGWGNGGDLYFGINRNLGTSKSSRIYSAYPLQKTQGWENFDIVTSITDALTGSDMTGVNIKNITVDYTIDVSSVSEINNIWFGTSLSTVTLKIEDITFKEKCSHINVESFNEPTNCGIKCSKCGKVINSFVTNISFAYGSQAYTDKFVFTDSVEFDGKTCARIETKENLNTSAAGYTQNFKVKFNGLISKMKAAGKTKVSFDFYLKNKTNGDVRFYWGVGDNKDYAWADHYNAITSIAGGKIAQGSMISQLGSKPCGDSHAQGRGFYCNDWYRLTVDLTDSSFAGYGDYFFISAYLGSSDFPTSALYLTNMNVTDSLIVNNGVSTYKVMYGSGRKTNADNFSKHFKEATGATLAEEVISTSNIVDDAKAIVIGDLDLANNIGLTLSSNNPSTYAIKSDKTNYYLIATDDDGYNLGTKRLLELLLGYDYYGKDTCSYDNVTNNSVPFVAINEEKTAGFQYRKSDWSSEYQFDPAEMGYNDGCLGNNHLVNSSAYYNANLSDQFHNSCLMVNPSSQPADYFNTNKDQLCYTAHDDNLEGNFGALINLVATNIANYFKNDTNLTHDTFLLGMMDNAHSCDCDHCKYYKQRYGSESGAVIRFLGLVYDKIKNEGMDIGNRSYDDIYLMAFAYINYTDAPSANYNSFNNHVKILFAPIYVDYRYPINDAVNAQYNTQLANWNNIGLKIELWLYETNFRNYLYPYISYESVFDTINYIRNNYENVITAYAQGQHTITGDQTGFTALKKYLDSKAMIGTNSTYAELVKKFFDNYFGAASSKMYEFFTDMCETYFNNYSLDKDKTCKNNYGGRSIYQSLDAAYIWPKAKLESWISLCNESLDLVGDNAALRRNIIQESIFPRFALVNLYKDSVANYNEMVTALKNDIESFNINAWCESGNNSLNYWYAQWGLI